MNNKQVEKILKEIRYVFDTNTITLYIYTRRREYAYSLRYIDISPDREIKIHESGYVEIKDEYGTVCIEISAIEAIKAKREI